MKNLERIAVFIDADNAQASKIEYILKDISAYGRIVIKRAYANWTKPELKPWEKEIKRFAIGTIQQFDFVTGKNASDIALTIDAMDLLHVGSIDGFVIVSSDSDFTSLAIKLHESGVYVIGYGRNTTVESFRAACDEFNYVENLDTNNENMESKSQSEDVKKDEDELDDLLKIAEEKYADEDGYVNVSSAGAYIKRVYPDFNIKTLGYKKLPEYLKNKTDMYDVKESIGKGGVKLIMYKIKLI